MEGAPDGTSYWDTRFSLFKFALDPGVTLTVRNLKLARALVFTVGFGSMQPAVFHLRPGSRLVLQNVVVQTMCSALRYYASFATFGVSTEASGAQSLTVVGPLELGGGSVTMDNVTMVCQPDLVPPSTGQLSVHHAAMLTTFINAASSLSFPSNISLMGNITLPAVSTYDQELHDTRVGVVTSDMVITSRSNATYCTYVDANYSAAWMFVQPPARLVVQNVILTRLLSRVWTPGVDEGVLYGAIPLFMVQTPDSGGAVPQQLATRFISNATLLISANEVRQMAYWCTLVSLQAPEASHYADFLRPLVWQSDCSVQSHTRVVFNKMRTTATSWSRVVLTSDPPEGVPYDADPFLPSEALFYEHVTPPLRIVATGQEFVDAIAPVTPEDTWSKPPPSTPSTPGVSAPPSLLTGSAGGVGGGTVDSVSLDAGSLDAGSLDVGSLGLDGSLMDASSNPVRPRSGAPLPPLVVLVLLDGTVTLQQPDVAVPGGGRRVVRRDVVITGMRHDCKRKPAPCSPPVLDLGQLTGAVQLAENVSVTVEDVVLRNVSAEFVKALTLPADSEMPTGFFVFNRSTPRMVWESVEVQVTGKQFGELYRAITSLPRRQAPVVAEIYSVSTTLLQFVGFTLGGVHGSWVNVTILPGEKMVMAPSPSGITAGTSSTEANSGGGGSTAAIIGASVGAAAGVCIAVIVAAVLVVRRRRSAVSEAGPAHAGKPSADKLQLAEQGMAPAEDRRSGAGPGSAASTQPTSGLVVARESSSSPPITEESEMLAAAAAAAVMAAAAAGGVCAVTGARRQPPHFALAVGPRLASPQDSNKSALVSREVEEGEVAAAAAASRPSTGHCGGRAPAKLSPQMLGRVAAELSCGHSDTECTSPHSHAHPQSGAGGAGALDTSSDTGRSGGSGYARTSMMSRVLDGPAASGSAVHVPDMLDPPGDGSGACFSGRGSPSKLGGAAVLDGAAPAGGSHGGARVITVSPMDPNGIARSPLPVGRSLSLGQRELAASAGVGASTHPGSDGGGEEAGRRDGGPASAGQRGAGRCNTRREMSQPVLPSCPEYGDSDPRSGAAGCSVHLTTTGGGRTGGERSGLEGVSSSPCLSLTLPRAPEPVNEVQRLISELSSRVTDQLTILEPIGQGGYGTVYRGFWRSLDVAVKTVLFQDRANPPPTTAPASADVSGTSGALDGLVLQQDGPWRGLSANGGASPGTSMLNLGAAGAFSATGVFIGAHPMDGSISSRAGSRRGSGGAAVVSGGQGKPPTVPALAGGGGVASQQRAVLEAAVSCSVAHPNVVATYHYDITPVRPAEVVCSGGLQVSDAQGVGAAGGGISDWKLYLVQEFCDAGSIAGALDRRAFHDSAGMPNLPLVLCVLTDITRGMAHIHSRSIVHGDLNPSNILLRSVSRPPAGASRAASGAVGGGTMAQAVQGGSLANLMALGGLSGSGSGTRLPSNGGGNSGSGSLGAAFPGALSSELGVHLVAKVADFGLCGMLAPGKRHISNALRGTPFYTAPETVATGTLTKASDVYSFGVIAWELYTGKPPFSHTPEHGFVRSEAFPRLPPHTPPTLASMTLACLNPDPDARPSFEQIHERFTSLQRKLAVQLQQRLSRLMAPPQQQHPSPPMPQQQQQQYPSSPMQQQQQQRQRLQQPAPVLVPLQQLQPPPSAAPAPLSGESHPTLSSLLTGLPSLQEAAVSPPSGADADAVGAAACATATASSPSAAAASQVGVTVTGSSNLEHDTNGFAFPASSSLAVAGGAWDTGMGSSTGGSMHGAGGQGQSTGQGWPMTSHHSFGVPSFSASLGGGVGSGGL